MRKLIEDIKSYLSESFKNDKKRLIHIYAVRDKAEMLGMQYHVDVNKAIVAALLHDATKNLPFETSRTMARKLISEECLSDVPKGCVHAYSAGVLAMDVFGIKDKEIIDAIIFHCSGAKAMSRLGQIIYVSDYIEENRTFADDELRKTAEENLDLATYQIMKRTVAYLKSQGEYVSPMTLEALVYYREIVEGMNE